jgi:hypothetical protein
MDATDKRLVREGVESMRMKLVGKDSKINPEYYDAINTELDAFITKFCPNPKPTPDPKILSVELILNKKGSDARWKVKVEGRKNEMYTTWISQLNPNIDIVQSLPDIIRSTEKDMDSGKLVILKKDDYGYGIDYQGYWCEYLYRPSALGLPTEMKLWFNDCECWIYPGGDMLCRRCDSL